ncbi:hypothetical protein PDJAM_G00129580 [Pangasius djambal]|uniref:Uncharacterized protein n=1 Tax=Pangasius djambal TaxID=1691987 RepID=A0ACC5ZBH2_9TELE|nr:hypothetical protein [Pangasius djambal]
MDPSSASAAPGSSPPSSSSSSVQPAEVQPSRHSAEPEPSPNTPSTTHATHPASTTAAMNSEEGGQDGQSEPTNQVAPMAHVSSLEMTNDEDLPTDPSNSSDTQEESEVESFCGDLRGRLHINTVVRMSVDKLHELLFSDTHFLQHLFTQRNFTDLSVQEWQKDSSSGISTRVLSYTIAINNPLGPKTAPVVETQTLHKSSSRGVCYVVDSEVITSGIPYQDYFYTVHRYCLTSVSTQKSRLRVSSDICYRKQPWSLVKALIEKNTWSGIEEYYRHMEVEVCKLETLLQSEVSVVCVGESEEVKAPPTLRRRKRTGSKRAEGAGHTGGVSERGGVAQRERRDTDLSVQEWQKDSSSGISTRVLSYTIAINNPLGPKTAPVVETQTLHKSSSRGVCYVVDSEVITSGIPYQDYFYTVHRYCLTSVSTQKSRLRVSSDICYRKQPWSLVKALIEKNTWSGIEEYYRHMEVEVCKLETLLQSEVSVVCVGESEEVKAPPTLRRRKRTGSKRAEGAGHTGGVSERGGVAQRERRDTGEDR